MLERKHLFSSRVNFSISLEIFLNTIIYHEHKEQNIKRYEKSEKHCLIIKLIDDNKKMFLSFSSSFQNWLSFSFRSPLGVKSETSLVSKSFS